MKSTEKKSLITKSLSIVDVLNKYAPRKIKQGDMCECPLHKDANPSCKINKNNTFYCFSCGAHGDMIMLTQKIFNLSFVDAMNKLVDDFGLEPNLTDEEKNKLKKEQYIKEQEKNIERWDDYLVGKYSRLISIRLMELRRDCTEFYRLSMLTNAQNEQYSADKKEIKELETLYCEMNKLYYDSTGHKKPKEIIQENEKFLENLQKALTL